MSGPEFVSRDTAPVEEWEHDGPRLRRPPHPRGGVTGPLRIRRILPDGSRDFGPAEVRNNLPDRVNYMPGSDAEREAQVKATLASIRRQVGVRRRRYAALRRRGAEPAAAAERAGVTLAGSLTAYECWYQDSLSRAGAS